MPYLIFQTNHYSFKIILKNRKYQYIVTPGINLNFHATWSLIKVLSNRKQNHR